VDRGELERRVIQGQEETALIQEAYDARAAGALRATNEDFYRVLRRGEFLHPDDFVPLLHEFLDASKGGARSGPTVILSGVLPNPPELLRFLDGLNVWVGEDDLLACSRRLVMPTVAGFDPFEALTDRYFLMAPCTTRAASIQERLDHLLKKVERSGARGVMFWMIKFCEVEFFDLPQLLEGLKRENLATLVVESELHQGLSGQMRTRIEAFVEMMS
jgi:benzoyl-CoA reductase/2-hydroxyglutaryl-CoA dehydratase subunit BcrC/BadD/HgdB